MKIPTKEEIKRDAEIIATYYMTLTDKGVKPSEAAYMAVVYLGTLKRDGEDKIPGDEWKQP